jgi:hypothetical protein
VDGIQLLKQVGINNGRNTPEISSTVPILQLEQAHQNHHVLVYTVEEVLTHS